MGNALSTALARMLPATGRADPVTATLLEYQRPSSAIIHAAVPRGARGVTWMVTSFAFALIATMGFIPVDQVVTARGMVVSQSPPLQLQPLETAIVRSIDVREGQAVSAGDVLARLDPTFVTADLGTLRAQQASLQAEVTRLEAEASGGVYVPEAPNAEQELQLTIFRHRQAEFQAKVATYRHKLDELNSIMTRSQLDAQAYRERLAVAEDVEKMRKTLEAKQIGARITTLAATDNRTEMARALSNAEKTAEGSARDIAGMQTELTAFIQGWSGETAQKLSDARRKLNDVSEQINKAQLRKDLVALRAERSGIVQSVAKVSVGSVVHSGQPLITLVPNDAALEVEANIPGRENGFVQVNNGVAIKFDTLPYTRYGMAEGVVRTVSPDAFTPQSEARNPTGASPQLSEPYYRARISLDTLALRNLPPSFRIMPGMPVTADVKVGERTVLTYLMGAIVPVAREGMREPQ